MCLEDVCALRVYVLGGSVCLEDLCAWKMCVLGRSVCSEGLCAYRFSACHEGQSSLRAMGLESLCTASISGICCTTTWPLTQSSVSKYYGEDSLTCWVADHKQKHKPS